MMRVVAPQRCAAQPSATRRIAARANAPLLPGSAPGPQGRLPAPRIDPDANVPELRTPAGADDQPEASTSGSGDDTGPQKPQGLVQILVSYAKLALAGALRFFAFLLAPIKKLISGPGNSVGRFALLFFTLILAQGWHASGQSGSAAPTEVLYSQFVARTRAGVVHSAIIDDHTHTLYFSMDPARAQAVANAAASRRWYQPGRRNPPAATPQALQTYSTRLIDKDTSYVRELVENGVHFGVKKQTLGGMMGRVFGGFLALWIPLIPFFIIFKRVFDAQSGKSKTTKQSFAPPDTTFKDVAGVDVVKAELEEAIQCLRNPGKFEKLNAQMPSGVLLCGPPGTGKTLLARAVAGEAGVPFFAVSASEFVEMFVGRGAARIRELFAQARKAAPSVVFIDELDAVGGKRGLGVNDERDQTLNQLLTELDGFERRPQVLLLAATNRPEVLDPALLRPGRISRRIVVPLPDQPGRREILAVHMRNIPMESAEFKGEAIEYLSALTVGFSGAELFNVVNEGALLAARRSEEVVSLTDLVNGVQRTRNGVNAPTGGAIGGLLQKLAEAVSPKAPVPVRSSTMV